ncbi:MAG: hypothetical protein P4L67_03615 [Candidatus Pacebacteria bacterium]|nr:hypothetical protein [Candidatus Paceibacterota bacterium]
MTRILEELIAEVVDGRGGGGKASPRTEDTSAASFDPAGRGAERHYSLMTRLMRSIPDQRSKSASYIVPPLEDDPKRQKLLVYLLDTKKTMTITVSRDNTIGQILRHVFYVCTACEVESSPVRLPFDSYEGYELRAVDDDEPIYEMEPLDMKRALGPYKLECVAFCARRNYAPQNDRRISIAHQKRNPAREREGGERDPHAEDRVPPECTPTIRDRCRKSC